MIMPYAKPSWRLWPQWRILSKMLCWIGIHCWLYSKTIGMAIACCMCQKKTKHYAEYKKIFTNDP